MNRQEVQEFNASIKIENATFIFSIVIIIVMATILIIFGGN
jgi:hypothetical protein